MSNLVELKTRPAAVNESVVARLEEVLAEARAGKVVGVAIASLHADGSIGSAWSEVDSFSGLLGSVARLQYRINVNQAVE